jgi:hypothetical protein
MVYQTDGCGGSQTVPGGNYCNTNPNYTGDLGSICIDNQNYTIRQNDNPCFFGDQWRSDNGTTYNYQPVSDPCPPPPPTAWEYNVFRCHDNVYMSIIADSSGLGQNVYSTSQEGIGTCYTIVSGPTGVYNYGSTYYYIGNCEDNRCAQL